MTPPETATVEPLLRDLRERAFGLPGSPGPLGVGIEVELLPPVGPDGRRVPLESATGRSALGLLREMGRELCWRESRTKYGSPCFRVPGGGTVSFEPGGQIEYSSPPGCSVDQIAEDAEGVVGRVAARMQEEGITMASRGIDPDLPSESATLALRSGRYRRLADHLESIGPAGRRMMLQTAAIHLNLDLGERPMERWGVANSLTPYLIATFANSARYAGAESGFRSYRAQQWRDLAPKRTGVFRPEEGAEAYLDFALDAPAILLGPEGEFPRPYREWIGTRHGTSERWREHLSTLFPEVRPRGYLEIRTVDALPPRWYSVPLVLVGGLLYDPEALRTAGELLDPAGDEDLARAGREGVRNPERTRRCRELFDLALEGAARLGPDFAGGRSLERTRAYRDRYPARGEDPAGDPECGRVG